MYIYTHINICYSEKSRSRPSCLGVVLRILGKKRISTGEATCIENRQLPGGSKWQLGNWATMRQDEHGKRCNMLQPFSQNSVITLI